MSLKNEKIPMENFNTNSSQKIFWAYQKSINQINLKLNHIKNYSNEEILNNKKTINFMDSNSYWMYTSFETNNNKNKLECPNIKNKKWDVQHQKVEEIRNLIFQSEEDINYNIVNCEIKSSFILKGESSFWIFLRSNYSFSISTVAICFSKVEFKQRIHLCLGIFHKNSEGNLTFRILNKHQLIFSDEIYNDNQNPQNEKYEKNDTIYVNTKIFDSGNQNLIVSTKLNESKYENVVKGNFFLPSTEEKNKIMIAGSGEQCKIKSFICNTIYKPEYSQNEPILDGNGCGCCLIF